MKKITILLGLVVLLVIGISGCTQTPQQCIEVGTKIGTIYFIGEVPGSSKISLNSVSINYQRYSDGYLYVQISYKLPSSTVKTNVGIYDCVTSGDSNAKRIESIGWVDEAGLQQAILLLKQNIPCECFK